MLDFQMDRTKSPLNPQEIDRLSEGMILAGAVDSGQMPHGGGQVEDSPERSLARAILFESQQLFGTQGLDDPAGLKRACACRGSAQRTPDG